MNSDRKTNDTDSDLKDDVDVQKVMKIIIQKSINEETDYYSTTCKKNKKFVIFSAKISEKHYYRNINKTVPVHGIHK